MISSSSTNVIADLTQFNMDDKGKFTTHLRSEVSEYVCTGLTDYIYTHTSNTGILFFSLFFNQRYTPSCDLRKAEFRISDALSKNKY